MEQRRPAVILFLLLLSDFCFSECIFEYTSQPPSTTLANCNPYYYENQETLSVNTTLECAVRKNNKSAEEFEIRWFRENGTKVEELGRGSPEVVTGNGTSTRSRYDLQFSPSLVGKYWCQVINTTSDPDQPLMRSNVFTLLGPGDYNGTTCPTVQAMANTTCADLPFNSTPPLTSVSATLLVSVSTSPFTSISSSSLASISTSSLASISKSPLASVSTSSVSSLLATISKSPHTSTSTYSLTTALPTDTALPTSTLIIIPLYALAVIVIVVLTIIVCVFITASVLVYKKCSHKTLKEQVAENVNMASMEFLNIQPPAVELANPMYCTTNTFQPLPPPPPIAPVLPPLVPIKETEMTIPEVNHHLHEETRRCSDTFMAPMMRGKSITSLHEGENRYSAVISELAAVVSST